MIEALERRITRTYVGTYAHLDTWVPIGTYQEIGRKDVEQAEEATEDPTEPFSHIVYAICTPTPDAYERWLNQIPPNTAPTDVDLNYNAWLDREIAQALLDRFNRHGCAHEYDCCGCWSYSASDAKRVTGDLWQVTVSGWRNY